jgi:hypothetical protein
VLKNPGGKGDVVLVLNAPDLEGGSCSTIDFKRDGRAMKAVSDECTSAGGGKFWVDMDGSMALDGNSISVGLDFIPVNDGPSHDRDPLNFERKIHFEFTGTRSTRSSPRLPAILSNR